MVLHLPDGTGDTETVLRECEDAIGQRQHALRQQVAATLKHTLEGAGPRSPCHAPGLACKFQQGLSAAGRGYEDQKVLSVLDCVALGANSSEDPTATEEPDHSTAENAGALAQSIRTLIDRTAEERLEGLNDRLAETQAAFEGALQQLQFIDAAYYLQQLRREVDDERAAAGALTACLVPAAYTH